MSSGGNNWAKISSEVVFTHWATALLSLFSARLCYIIISRRWFSPLSEFPGPFWGSITDLYSAYINLSGKLHLIQYDLHKKYGEYSIHIGRGKGWGWLLLKIALKFTGPIVRYRPDLLIVSDPTMLPVIYHRYADKTNYYLQAVGAPTAFTCLKHKDHTIARRRISGPVRNITETRIKSLTKTSISFPQHYCRGLKIRLTLGFTNGQINCGMNFLKRANRRISTTKRCNSLSLASDGLL